jgi:hypothetical protein
VKLGPNEADKAASRTPVSSIPKIDFPFQAKCLAAKVASPLRKGENGTFLESFASWSYIIGILIIRHPRDDQVSNPPSQFKLVACDQ